MKKSFLIAATFVLGLIVNINVGTNGIKLTTHQDMAEAEECHRVMRYCGSTMGWKCLLTESAANCTGDECYTASECSS